MNYKWIVPSVSALSVGAVLIGGFSIFRIEVIPTPIPSVSTSYSPEPVQVSVELSEVPAPIESSAIPATTKARVYEPPTEPSPDPSDPTMNGNRGGAAAPIPTRTDHP